MSFLVRDRKDSNYFSTLALNTLMQDIVAKQVVFTIIPLQCISGHQSGHHLKWK